LGVQNGGLERNNNYDSMGVFVQGEFMGKIKSREKKKQLVGRRERG